MRHAALLVFALSATALASTPSGFVLQQEGRLLDQNEQPVTAQVPMTFAIWDGPFADAQSDWSATVTVPVVGGVYALALGDTTSGQPAIDPRIFAAGASRFLSVTIGGAELLPRLQIGTAPHAIDADALGGVPAASYAQLLNLDALSESTRQGLAALGGSLDALSETLVQSIAAAKADAISEAQAYALAQDGGLAATLAAQIQSAHDDAVSKAQVFASSAQSAAIAASESNAAARYLPLAGGTLTGLLTAGAGILLPGLSGPPAACTSGNAGLVYFDSTASTFYGCDGKQWRNIGGAGTTPTATGTSCAALQAKGKPTGLYWLQPSGQDDPFQAWCDQDDNGGGWALVYSSVAGRETARFWAIPYAQRLTSRGGVAPGEDSYDPAAYLFGTSYFDQIVDQNGKVATAFLATTSGIDTATMRFNAPALVSGDGNIYGCQFASGWSSADYHGDTWSSNCASQEYPGISVTQHYCNCWDYNLGTDHDSVRGVDAGWGPHVYTPRLTSLGLADDGSSYSRVQRISRYAKW